MNKQLIGFWKISFNTGREEIVKAETMQEAKDKLENAGYDISKINGVYSVWYLE